MKLTFQHLVHELAEPFRISRGTITQADVLYVELEEGGVVARGEAAGVDYHGDTLSVMLEQAAEAQAAIARGGVTRESLQKLLPPGGARNAIDCAFWDLEAKSSGVPASERAGFATLKPLRTTMTLGIDTPARMAEKARRLGDGAFIKIKLGDQGDMERLQAIRNAVPTADLVVDANQAWTFNQLMDMAPKIVQFGVKLIEQPLSADADEELRDYRGVVPVCADEACDDRSTLDRVVGKYSYINIKLDKTGGLTEALALAKAATDRGLKLMVGCMSGTSLCLAPGFIIGQMCDVVDLDCAPMLKKDIDNGMQYAGNTLFPYSRALWG